MINDSQHTAQEGDPQQLIAEFMSAFRSSSAYLRENITRLAELAASENTEVAESATGAFFASLVERLADSFDPAAVALYNRIFAQIIQYCRATRAGRAIDSALESFGLRSEQDIFTRAETLRLKPSPVWQSSVRRVIVLSRVTLGADVAITSIIIERMKREFHGAEIALVGGRKAAELLGGDERLAFKEVSYRRAGTTIERLLSWIDLLGVIRELTEGLSGNEYLIVDPDTRLTQLGLLPLTSDDSQYLFFPSREYAAATSGALGHLTSAWLGEVFGADQKIYPRLSLARADLDMASGLAKRLRQTTARPVATINFGVGGNPAKRAGDEFELSIVTRLISQGVIIILDRGAGEDEAQRCDAIIRHARKANRKVVECDEVNLADMLSRDSIDAELIVWNGRIGMLAALISESDLYIGYDSAGQHIAAALGIPTIDVFAGFASQRMLDRWRPTGPAQSRVIAVGETRNTDASALIANTLAIARQMLNDRNQKSEAGSQKPEIGTER